MKPEGSSLHSHQPVTCPYHEPDQPCPCPQIPLPKDSSCHLHQGLPNVIFSSRFLHQNPACVLNAAPISFFSILLPEQHWVSSTDY